MLLRMKDRLHAALTGLFITSSVFCSTIGAAIPTYDTANPVDCGQLTSGTNPVLDENSGIDNSTKNPSVIWMHDDGGDNNTNIYAMTKLNKVIRKYNLQGAAMGAWEDITVGPGPTVGASYIYPIGCGDNSDNRGKIDIHRFLEPTVAQGEINSAPNTTLVTNISAGSNASTQYQHCLANYPDRGHDCEAASIDPISGDLYLFSKTFPANPCNVYKLTKTQLQNALAGGATPTMTLVATGLQAGINATNKQVVSADFSPDGQYFVHKNQSEAFMWQLSGYANWDQVFINVKTAPRYLKLADANFAWVDPGVGEAICFDATNYDLYTISEGQNMHLWRFNSSGGGGDVTPPDPITNFDAAPGDGQVFLTWNNPTDSDFAGVMIRRLSGSYPTSPTDGSLCYQGTGTSFTDTGRTNGTDYYYSAFAYDEVPNYSTVAQDHCIPVDNQPPADVTNVQATPGSGQIVLGWTNPTNADFAGVRICRSTSSPPATPASGTNVYENTGTSLTDTPLTDGTTYYYTLFSKDEVPNWSTGISIWAAPGDTTPPGPITNFDAAPGDGEVFLTWTNPTDSDFAGVMIRRLWGSYPTSPTDGNLCYQGTGTSFTDPDRNNGTDYYYSAFAYDEVPNYSTVAQDHCIPVAGSTEVTFTSVAAEDGWVAESNETSNVGGSFDAILGSVNAVRLGDNSSKGQYKAFVSFDSSSIPDGATILSAQLQLTRGGVTNDPSGFGTIRVDIRNGGFNGNVALENADFQAAATQSQVTTIPFPTANLQVVTGDLNASGLTAINKTGKTQLRIYFATDDDNDSLPDYLGFYSSDNANSAYWPKLVINYQ